MQSIFDNEPEKIKNFENTSNRFMNDRNRPQKSHIGRLYWLPSNPCCFHPLLCLTLRPNTGVIITFSLLLHSGTLRWIWLICGNRPIRSSYVSTLVRQRFRIFSTWISILKSFITSQTRCYDDTNTKQAFKFRISDNKTKPRRPPSPASLSWPSLAPSSSSASLSSASELQLWMESLIKVRLLWISGSAPSTTNLSQDGL